MTTANPETWIGEGPVLLDYADHVARITLNRPDAANGMNIEFMKAFHEAVMRCHREPDVRVVLLRGAGSISAPAAMCASSPARARAWATSCAK